jgi:lysine-specific permease
VQGQLTCHSIALFYFIDISANSFLVQWVTMAITHIRWRKAVKVQKFPLDRLPVVSHLQPYGAW